MQIVGRKGGDLKNLTYFCATEAATVCRHRNLQHGNGLAQGLVHRTLGSAGRRRDLAHLDHRHRAGQDPPLRHLARHGLHLFRGNPRRTPRPHARPCDAGLRRELRPDYLRLRPRPAGRPGLLQLAARRRAAPRLAGHRRRGGRHAAGRCPEHRLRRTDARHVGHSLRRDDQYAGPRRRTADPRPTGTRHQRRGIELRGDLPAGRRGGHSGHRLPAQALRATVGPARSRCRAPQKRLHRQLPPDQSGGLRPQRPRDRRTEPPPLRHLARMARRQGFDPHLGQDAPEGRRHPRHHHPRRGRRPAADLRRAGAEGLEQGEYRLERHRQPAHLAAHSGDAPRDQRAQARVAASAQQLRHQHQPRLPLGRAAARHTRPAFAVRRPPHGRGRSRGDPRKASTSRTSSPYSSD